MTTPEARARINIDDQLIACGWSVQNRAAMNLYAARRVADYLLFVDRQAVGIVEAKAEGVLLLGVK